MAPTVHQARFTEKALKDLPDRFLMCRDPSSRHPWDLLEDFHVIPATTEGRRTTHVARKYLCPRCSTKDSPTIKTEYYIVVRRGGVERLERLGSPTIDYTEGYLIPGVPRGVKPAEIIRAEQYRRSLEKAVKAKRGQRSTAER